MKTPWKLRIKRWICIIFGHRKEYSHSFGNRHWFTCKRCHGIDGKFKGDDTND